MLLKHSLCKDYELNFIPHTLVVRKMCCFCPLATVFTWSIGTLSVGRRCSCHKRWCQRNTDWRWLTRIICISIREVDLGNNDLGEIFHDEHEVVEDCCIINDRASSLTIPDLVKHLCIASGWVLLSFIQFYHLAQREFCTLLDTVDGKWHQDMNLMYRTLSW